MTKCTVYEFDALTAEKPSDPNIAGLHSVPKRVFAWLAAEALRLAEQDGAAWLRLSQAHGRPAVRVNSFVGVVRTPCGYQIEVLPKVAEVIGGGAAEARILLIEMLRCLQEFPHIQTANANLAATNMPLLEIFIGEFLHAVERIVKRGLQNDYRQKQENLFALRGKLQMASHLRQNLCRRDRFFTETDEFSSNRPENRLLHTALHRVLAWTHSQANHQLARELSFVFAEVPISTASMVDFSLVRHDRCMVHYEAALDWARLILQEKSPLTGDGQHCAPSLLFPMEKVFEAFVAKCLAKQLMPAFYLREQAQNLCLVRHLAQDWFRLKPDLLVLESKKNRLVLDTKWKLIDASKGNSDKKYGLAQQDFYQLSAYGQNYLEGQGSVVLIYPKTDALDQALPKFEFIRSSSLCLWVLPFCLREKRLLLPQCGSLDEFFAQHPQ
ncbi:MAG: 2-keto-D-gluconate dehydrogenase [Desulfovibrio sp. MES5]|uniref:McrC family protein n=1 Tax=Desulfovibrio sp. MES5 TaxID=1899016 RepID=UPI000B9D16C3|nr:McrC family protein [Desulfovibrio sp. MES5]OXS29351.1 MAG: 2-keto-D-gluconate dehydrogenase [Desulfovibrio sp. MES5]